MIALIAENEPTVISVENLLVQNFLKGAPKKSALFLHAFFFFFNSEGVNNLCDLREIYQPKPTHLEDSQVLAIGSK